MSRRRALAILLAVTAVVAAVVVATGSVRLPWTPQDEVDAAASPRPDEMPALSPATGAPILEAARSPTAMSEPDDVKPSGPTKPTSTRGGSVVDAAGKPVAGAVVRVWGAPAEAPPITTDAQGRFSVPDDGDWIAVWVGARPLVVKEPRSWLSPDGSTQITLVRGLPLSVHVTRASDGSPIAGARVRSICGEEMTEDVNFRRRAHATDESRTDADGRAVVLAPEGAAYAAVDASGFAPDTSETVYVAAAGAKVEVRLSPGGRVEGSVKGPDGKPVANALVHCIQGGRFDGTTRTGEDGTFQFVDVPARARAANDASESHPAPSSWRHEDETGVSVRADGFAPVARMAARPDPGSAVRADFTLQRALAIEGIAVEADGTPVAGSEVRAQPSLGAWFTVERMGDAPAQAMTDVQGRFRLTPVAPGENDIKSWRREGGVAFVFTKFSMPASGDVPTLTLKFEAKGPRSLSLRVLDPEGAPVGEALVDVEFEERRNDLVVREDTAADGTLEVTGLPAARLRLAVQKANYASSIVEVDLVGGDRNGLEVRFGSESATVEVVRLDGSPARCAIRLHRFASQREDPLARSSDWCWPAAELDASGRATFRNLGAAEYSIEMDTSGLHLIGGPARFRAGPSLLHFVAATDAEAEARRTEVAFVDLRGEPIRGLVESVKVLGGLGAQECDSVEDSPSPGHFLTPALAPGTYEFAVVLEGFLPENVRDIRLDGRGHPVTVRLTLDRGATLEGRVTDAKGHPIPFTGVWLANRVGDIGTDEDGRYALPGLADGEARIRFAGPYLLEEIERVVVIDRTRANRLDVVGQPAGSVDFKCAAKPKVDVALHIVVKDAKGIVKADEKATSRFWYDHDERVPGLPVTAESIGSLPAGIYTLEVSWDEKPSPATTAEVKEFETTIVTLTPP